MTFPYLNMWPFLSESSSRNTDFIFLGSKITVDDDCSHKIKRHLLLGRKAMRYLDSGLKGRDSILPMKIPLSGQSYGVSSSLLGMRELDHKEGWAWNCRCFGTVVLEKPLEGPLDCKEIKPINHKGNQPWIFIGRTGAEAEARMFWPPDVKSWLTGKDPDVGKNWGQEEKGDRRWSDWMASSTQRTWIWANSGRSWRAGKPGVLQSVGSQRVGHDLATEQQQQRKYRVRYFMCLKKKKVCP